MSGQKHFSCEFFPPKTAAGLDSLKTTASILSQQKLEFFSVTYGAGGSTRNKTGETISALRSVVSEQVAPHISCVAATRAEISSMLDEYKQANIQRLVVLRGDLPSGMGMHDGDFSYANELVSFIREQWGDYFTIDVAAYPEFHPESANARQDLMNFKRKVDAGANSAITQYFYNPDAYFRLVEACDKVGITIPIIPGVMPIYDLAKLERFSDACGAEIPRWLKKRLATYADDATAFSQFSIDVITRLGETLLSGGAPGLHFYTLNKSEPTSTILSHLSAVAA